MCLILTFLIHKNNQATWAFHLSVCTGARLISVGISMNFESIETVFVINFSLKFCF